MFRKFIVETIRLGRRLRPNALWGLYDTPLCNYDAGERWPGGCREQFRKHNDKLVRNNCNLMQNQLCRLWWLYAEASALYSSIYLHPGDRKRRQGICERHMQAKVAEAEWIWCFWNVFLQTEQNIEGHYEDATDPSFCSPNSNWIRMHPVETLSTGERNCIAAMNGPPNWVLMPWLCGHRRWGCANGASQLPTFWPTLLGLLWPNYWRLAMSKEKGEKSILFQPHSDAPIAFAIKGAAACSGIGGDGIGLGVAKAHGHDSISPVFVRAGPIYSASIAI